MLDSFSGMTTNRRKLFYPMSAPHGPHEVAHKGIRRGVQQPSPHAEHDLY
jgi:hypothetical protein